MANIYDKILKEYQDNMVNQYDKLYSFITDFISRNGEALGSKNPAKYIYWSKNDEAEFYETINADPKKIKSFISESSYIQKNWIISNDPKNFLMDTMVFFYYTLKDNYKKMNYPPHNLTNLLFTLRFYSSLQQRQFKYEVDEQVMTYTVDNLSKKFNLTKFNSMFEMLIYYADSTLITFEEDKKMLIHTDKNLDDYMKKLNTRLSSFIINVARKYYENHAKSKRTIDEGQTIDFDEGKSVMRVQSSVSTDVALVSKRVLQQFKTNLTNTNYLKIACNATGASFVELYGVLEEMRQGQDKEVEELITSMLSLYLITNKRGVDTIKSAEFLKEMVTAYGVSNTNDDYIIKIKKILDNLMKKYSELYLKTNRTATQSNMRAAIYRYFVYIIMAYA